MRTETEEYDPFAAIGEAPSMSASEAKEEGVVMPDEEEPKPNSKKHRNLMGTFGRLTREYFEKRGGHYGRVEHIEPRTGMKADLFGFIDGVAVMPRHYSGAIGVQVCGRTGILPHLRAACINDETKRYRKNRGTVLVDWLLAGNHFWVMAWHQPEKKRGSRWQPVIIDVTLSVVQDVQAGKRVHLKDLPQVKA